MFVYCHTRSVPALIAEDPSRSPGLLRKSNGLSRRALAVAAVKLGLGALSGCHSGRVTPSVARARPVIMDADIGDDIDDTWALLMLLGMPELDLRLVVGDYGNAIYRGRLFAKLLETVGRSDVPVGLGLGIADRPGQQSGWVGDYQLQDYPGTVIEDGVQAIIQVIKGSPEPVTLLCLGPVPNIAEALRREPSIATNARFVGMHGSIYRGYGESSQPAPEYNVRQDPQSLQAVFAAPWDCAITPLDTCGQVVLDGPEYAQLHRSEQVVLKALMANFRAWLPGAPYIDPNLDPGQTSTTLFDTVAVYMAARRDLLEMRSLPLRVTDDGYTVIDPARGRPVDCAIGWRDMAAFETYLVSTLLE